MSDTGKVATPSEVLREQITNSNVPKNEREWWAAHEIASLTAALRAAEERAEKAEAALRATFGPNGHKIIRAAENRARLAEAQAAGLREALAYIKARCRGRALSDFREVAENALSALPKTDKETT